MVQAAPSRDMSHLRKWSETTLGCVTADRAVADGPDNTPVPRRSRTSNARRKARPAILFCFLPCSSITDTGRGMRSMMPGWIFLATNQRTYDDDVLPAICGRGANMAAVISGRLETYSWPATNITADNAKTSIAVKTSSI